METRSSEEDLRAFAQFSKGQIHSRVRRTALACVGLFLSAWVIGRVVLSGHALEAPGRFWLGVLAAISALAWASFRWARWTREHPAAGAIAFHVLISGCAAAHSAQMGGLDGPFFYAVYILPPLSIGLALERKPRIVMTLFGPLAWVLAFSAVHPEAGSHPMLHVPTIILSGVVVVSIYLGDQLQAVLRERFLLARRLERQQARLARHAETLEGEVAEGARAIEHLSRVLAQNNLERTDVARALHDDLGQLIVGVRIELEVLERKIAAASAPGLDPGLLHLSSVVESMDGSVRTFIERLREPSPVDDLGESLEALVAPLRARSGMVIRTDVAVEEDLRPQAREVMYRLVQEAVTNVFKHASATELDIRVRQRGDRVEGEVRDDGKGFAPHASDGLGLTGLRERALEFGGTLEIESGVQGTAIRLSVPVAPEVARADMIDVIRPASKS